MMRIVLVLLFVFLCSMFLFYIALKQVVKKRQVNRRIRKFVPTAIHSDEEETDRAKESVVRKGITAAAKAFYGIRVIRQAERKLEEAGMSVTPEEFFVLRLLVAVGAGCFAALISSSTLMIFVLAGAGFLAPYMYMEQKRKKRLQLISYQLIDVLAIMANAMRAGFSFMQAMQLAGKEMPDPLGPEFERVIREVGLGISLEEAFQNLLKRLPNTELEVVVNAILIQRTGGGNMAELMETMEETVRGRIRVLEELKTLTAQGRMSSWVITILPIALGLYLNAVSPDYFQPMLHHPLGWVMLGFAGISIIIGWSVIQKIIQIEV